MSSKNLKENEQHTAETSPNVEQQVSTDHARLKEKAQELMKQLGLDKLYYTADGFWFSQKELANNHAQATKVETTEFKQ